MKRGARQPPRASARGAQGGGDAVDGQLVGPPTMVRRHHRHQSLAFINSVEKSVVADAIAPRLWREVPELLDVRAEIGVVSKLRVD